MVEEFLVRSEDMGQTFREGHEKRPGNHRKGDAHDQKITEGLSDPAGVFGAVVIGNQRLGALAKPRKGQERELNQGEEDRHRSDRDVTPEFLERGIEANGQNALADLHQESRAPQKKQRADFSPIRSHEGEAEPPHAVLRKEEGHDPNAGYRLRNDGRTSRAFDPHPEGEDEKRIERDIEDGANQDREHRGGGLAHRGDEAIEPEGEFDEEGPDRVDVHVIEGVADRVLRSAKREKHRFIEAKEKNRQNHAENRQKDGGIRQDFLGFGIVFLTGGDRGFWSASAPDEVGESRDPENERRADA